MRGQRKKEEKKVKGRLTNSSKNQLKVVRQPKS